MTKIVLSIHVLAAIILIGPATVAASLFPRYARQALAPDAAAPETVKATAALRLLHRVTRVYAAASVAVPAFGIGTAQMMGVMGDAWLIASMALTTVAAVLLAFAVFTQDAVIDALDARETEDGTPDLPALTARLPRLAMATGLFALTWTAVTILMIIRPGSTTGA
ncbi:membrane protein [Streptomyces olivoverticillatus]